MKQELEQERPFSHKERLEEINQEILEILQRQEALCRRRLWEIDKHLEMHARLYYRYRDFFQEMVRNVEDMATMQGQSYEDHPQRLRYLSMLDEAEDKYYKTIANLESEKYRLEEEMGYLRYRKGQFLMEKKANKEER